MHRARFRPRRPLSMGVAIALATLVAIRVWQLSTDRTPEKLDEGHYLVESVTDGDTLRLAGGARVRLIGVDAPETKLSPRSGGEDQPLARDALEFVERAAAGRKLRLEFDKERIDKYGRFLAYVWYVDRQSGEELMLNEELVRAGLARARLGYSYSERMKRRFRAAEQEAREAGRGIWSRAARQPVPARGESSVLQMAGWSGRIAAVSGEWSLEVYSLPGVYEPFSVFSHLAGAVLFAVLGRRLLRRSSGDRLRLAVLGVYIGSCVLLFAASGIYHMLTAESTARAVMARVDHSAIFVLIAGTFTPVHGILFQGWARWAPLLVIWAAALAGIALKSVYFAELAGWLSLSVYLFLGWLGALSGTWLALRHGFAFVKPALWGGIAYSAGAISEFVRWPVIIPGIVHPHELFHVAVLIGAFFHWLFIWRIAALPPPPMTVRQRCAST